MAEHVARELEGSWVAVSSENIDSYLTTLGVGCCERKTLSTNKLWQKIRVRGDVIHIEMCHSNSRYIELKFRLNETFEIRAGKLSNAMASWTDGALLLNFTRVDTGLKQRVERRLVGTHMVQKMVLKDVTCSRTFVKVKESDLE